MEWAWISDAQTQPENWTGIEIQQWTTPIVVYLSTKLTQQWGMELSEGERSIHEHIFIGFISSVITSQINKNNIWSGYRFNYIRSYCSWYPFLHMLLNHYKTRFMIGEKHSRSIKWIHIFKNAIFRCHGCVGEQVKSISYPSIPLLLFDKDFKTQLIIL